MSVDEYLTDHQQAERVRSWIRENGFFVAAGVVLGLAGLFGWNWYQDYQRGRAEAASRAYEAVAAAAEAQNLDEATAALERLTAEFGNSPYAAQGRMLLASLQMERSAPEEAAALLDAVLASGADAPLEHIARLRLARIRIFQERYDAALDLLRVPSDSGFAAAYHEARGDAYVALGRPEEARPEYEQALADSRPGLIDRGYVQAKLDDLGLLQVPSADAPAPAAESEPTVEPTVESEASE